MKLRAHGAAASRDRHRSRARLAGTARHSVTIVVSRRDSPRADSGRADQGWRAVTGRQFEAVLPRDSSAVPPAAAMALRAP